MSQFFRLLYEVDKAEALLDLCQRFRAGTNDDRIFEVAPDAFDSVPTKPFAYWISDAVRQQFTRLPTFEGSGRTVRQGLATANDFRFVRLWWEVECAVQPAQWSPFAKGGGSSAFYADVVLTLNWGSGGKELKAWADPLYGNSGWSRIIKSTDYYFRPGLTWPLRGAKFSCQVVPRGCIFSVAGKMAFAPPERLSAWLAIFNSRAFDYLIRIFAGKVGGVQYEAGLIGGIPVSPPDEAESNQLSKLAQNAWRLKRRLDTVREISHAFVLPSAIRARVGDFDPAALEGELLSVQTQIDNLVFARYGFSDADKKAASTDENANASIDTSDDGDPDEEGEVEPPDERFELLSWAVGVAFGRFDLRLATRERPLLDEPEPFDLLPAKSPGMLPDGEMPFHAHAGILVDDPGHPNDLVRLAEEVLTRVDVPVPSDIRRWLRKDFFPSHLQRYSKSRRKAPIYWPLSTTSGSYTLWVYYPSLTSQTLYTAINEFLDGPNGKLKEVGALIATLRGKGSTRTRDDEKQFEAVQTFELELVALRDSLLNLAALYRPSHDDGVQISAAPLWPLFRYKAWQKLLKETWAKLEKGEYDWAHLAMNYWPDRVREKCKTDKSLAIAHGLESLYVVPEVAPKKSRGKKKGAEA